MPLTNGFHHLDHATERLPFVPAGIDGAVGRDETLAIASRLVRRLRRRPPPGHRFRDAGDVARSLAREARVRWTAAGESFERALLEGHGIDDEPGLVGEPAFDGGHLLADALAGDSAIDRVEQGLRRVADGLGVATERPRDWALVRPVEFARWAYEIDEVDEGGPEGRLTLARSLAGLAER
jgi:hypothetical protein